MITTRTGLADASPGILPSVRPRPRPAQYRVEWSILLLFVDALAVTAAGFTTRYALHGDLDGLLASTGPLQIVAFSTLLWFMLFERIGMYRRTFSANARDEVYASLAACAMATLPALAIFTVHPALAPYRHPLLLTLVSAIAYVGAFRFGAHVVRTTAFPRTARRIAVIGAPQRVAGVPGDLSLTLADSVLRFSIETFDEDMAAAASGADLADIDWLRAALEAECDEIIFTEAVPADVMPKLLRLTESRGVALAFASLRIRPHACDFSVRRDGGLALLYPRSLAICTPGAEAARRALDLALTVPSIVLLAPLLLVVAVAVAATSRGPVFYRQTRTGRHGTRFEIVKFRTMHVDAEAESGPVWARTGESRTTRVGRFLRRTSLDELPQLFNVLRGDMSIVGPRPERPFYVEQFRKMLPRYDERHLVRPGITGWSHIHMRRNVDTSAIGERLSYDLFYLEHWSVFMDIMIICKTAAEFLFHSAA